MKMKCDQGIVIVLEELIEVRNLIKMMQFGNVNHHIKQLDDNEYQEISTLRWCPIIINQFSDAKLACLGSLNLTHQRRSK